MKFFITLMFALAALAYAENGDPALRTKCSYFRDTSLLNCKGPLGKVECMAASGFPEKFNIVGLGFDQDSVTPPQPRFRLFPLKTDNTGWLNHTFAGANGQGVSLSIFNAADITDGGLRVRDENCFDRLASVFRSSISNLIVPLGRVTAEHPRGFTRLSLFGEIFFFDKSFSSAAPVTAN